MTDELKPLAEAEELLRKYGNTPQANLVAKCRKSIMAGAADAYQKLATAEWWGGSGSIADVNLHRVGWKSGDEERQDDRSFRLALVEVYELMKAKGVEFERAEFWATTFRKWNEQDI